MPMLTGRAQIAIKQEGTAGTSETLALADAIMPKGESTWDPDVVMVPREGQTSSLDSQGSVVGTKAAKIKFAQYLEGAYNHSTGAVAAPVAGSTEPAFSVPFKGCGALLTVSGAGGSEIATYTPSSTTISDESTGAYCTVSMYLDGKRYMIHGAVGNCVLTLQVGHPILAEYEFTGVWNTPDDEAFLVPVYPTFAPPAFLSASMSVIGSYTTARLQTLKLDFGNQITMRPNPNGANGILSYQITGRKPTGSFDPEETLVSVKDWYAEWVAGTTGAITTGAFPSGGTQYNKFTLNVPKSQYTKVGLGSRDGIATAAHDFEARANSVAGDDSWSLVVS